MKVLVTGGAGFIGSHLVDALLDCGSCVTVLDNFKSGRLSNLRRSSDIRIWDIDITDTLAMEGRLEKFDVIYHLAAVADIVPSITSPRYYYDVNVTGTLNILEYARKSCSGRVVYTASSSCYGIPHSYPTSESSAIEPQYPYALTKYLGEQLVLHWGSVYGISTISLRLFNVYGRRSRTTGAYGAVLGVFLRQRLAGHKLTVVGDGTQSRDFTHVSDVVTALVLAGNSPKESTVYNVGSGRTESVLKLAGLISSNLEFIPKRPGEPDKTFADISKIANDLGYRPRVKLEDGMKEILLNISEWSDAPLWTAEAISKETSEWFKYLGGRGHA